MILSRCLLLLHTDAIRQGYGEPVQSHRGERSPSCCRRSQAGKGQEVVDRDLYAYPDLFMSNSMVRFSGPGRQLSAGEVKGILIDTGSLIRICSHIYFETPLLVKGIPNLGRGRGRKVSISPGRTLRRVQRFRTLNAEGNVRPGSTSHAHFGIPKPLSI